MCVNDALSPFLFGSQQLYMNFVKNVKFTSPSTKPLIAFMQNSLVEMFSVDHHVTYQHAFVYIRQLAIHLRNGIVQKKKVRAGLETNIWKHSPTGRPTFRLHSPVYIGTSHSSGIVLFYSVALRESYFETLNALEAFSF